MIANTNMRQALQALRSEVGRGTEPGNIEERDNRLKFDVRDFGAWQNPADARDEEDYDWQEPTPATVVKLDALMAKYTKANPTLKFSYTVEEKNWLTFTVEAK